MTLTYLRTLADFHQAVVVRQLKLSGNRPDLDRRLIGNQILPERHIRTG